MPDYGEYGPDYWNNKWEKAPIIYAGRTLLEGDTIGIDVRAFLLPNDAIINEIVKQKRLKGRTPNETADRCQRFVYDYLHYTYDEESSGCPEFWQFPFETVQRDFMIGDCEDGAILIAALMINADVPAWRVKVAGGYVQASPTAPVGEHAYCIYLADRNDSSRGLEWVILDWCYRADPQISPGRKPFAKDKSCYKDLLFSFNNEYSWAQTSLEISASRISREQTLKEGDISSASDDYIKKIANKFK